MLDRLRKQFFNVHPSELPLALAMFGYFFLVITSFWILKPIKKSLFVQFYEERGFTFGGFPTLDAAQAELVAKVLNMVVAMVAVVVFTLLARRLRREGLTFVFTGFFLAAYVLYALVVNTPSGTTAWSFYLFGDLFSTLMVATFFAFLNDSVTPEGAKRLYGPVVLGGVLGGAFGTTFVAARIAEYDTSTWLWICFGLGVGILGLAALAGRLVRQSPPPEVASGDVDPGRGEQTHTVGNAAVEGARLVFRSRYLLSIAAIVGIYEIISTMLDFQFTSTILHYLSGDAIGAQFARVFAFTNIVAAVVQLLVTPYVLNRYGVKTALLVTPAMMLLGSAGFLIAPVLLVGSLLNTTDSGFAYSINQSGREALYTPTSRDEKYKAKAFIDMFVQRFAKAIAVFVSLGITLVFTEFGTIRWLSLGTIALIAVWVVAARYAGRQFDALTGPEGPPAPVRERVAV